MAVTPGHFHVAAARRPGPLDHSRKSGDRPSVIRPIGVPTTLVRIQTRDGVALDGVMVEPKRRRAAALAGRQHEREVRRTAWGGLGGQRVELLEQLGTDGAPSLYMMARLRELPAAWRERITTPVYCADAPWLTSKVWLSPAGLECVAARSASAGDRAVDRE